MTLNISESLQGLKSSGLHVGYMPAYRVTWWDPKCRVMTKLFGDVFAPITSSCLACIDDPVDPPERASKRLLIVNQSLFSIKAKNWPLTCWNLSTGSKVTVISPLCQLNCTALQMIWLHYWIGLEKLPQMDLSHDEIHPQDPKLQQLSSSGQPNSTIPNQICQKLKFGLKTT